MIMVNVIIIIIIIIILLGLWNIYSSILYNKTN